MNHAVKTGMTLLLAMMFIAACSGAPEAQRDPYNSPDSQRDRSRQAQDELSTETK